MLASCPGMGLMMIAGEAARPRDKCQDWAKYVTNFGVGVHV